MIFKDLIYKSVLIFVNIKYVFILNFLLLSIAVFGKPYFSKNNDNKKRKINQTFISRFKTNEFDYNIFQVDCSDSIVQFLEWATIEKNSRWLKLRIIKQLNAKYY